MKKLSCLLALVSLLLACNKEEKEGTHHTPEENVKITSLTLSPNPLSMKEGSIQELQVTVSPATVKDYTLSWSSSEPSVASVEGGVVTALAVGTAVISVSAQEVQAECQVTVTESSIKISSLSSDAAFLKGAGGSAPVGVTLPGSWTVSSSADWLDVAPSSGNAGLSELVLTTLPNTSGEDRTARITFSSGGESYTLPVRQRAHIFTRFQSSYGRVTNGFQLTYNGTKFTRIYFVLPRPVTNDYQEITNMEAVGCTEEACPDGQNYYIWRDASAADIPPSGSFIISESFDAKIYNVRADFSRITDIPAYDPQSEECRLYLKKEENGLIDPTHSKIVSTANSLWGESFGNIISYARKCYNWTYESMTYGNMNTGLHTIAQLMRTMTGDCGNYSSVFISLLRAKGIPARHVVMVHGMNDEFHVRAEFYVPAYGWIPADPTWGGDNFGVFSGPLVVMTRGINNVIRDCDGNDYEVPLLQTGCYWFWYQKEGTFSFTHTCTGLK